MESDRGSSISRSIESMAGGAEAAGRSGEGQGGKECNVCDLQTKVNLNYFTKKQEN